MRKLLLLFQPFAICVLAACAFHAEEDWRHQITGRYVMQYKQPYSIGWDTLVIQRLENSSSKQFIIQRHTKYQRIINGKKGPAVLKITVRYVTADESSPTLVHTTNGRRYAFDPVKQEITTGNVIYYKLK